MISLGTLELKWKEYNFFESNRPFPNIYLQTNKHCWSTPSTAAHDSTSLPLTSINCWTSNHRRCCWKSDSESPVTNDRERIDYVSNLSHLSFTHSPLFVIDHCSILPIPHLHRPLWAWSSIVGCQLSLSVSFVFALSINCEDKYAININ